VIEKGAFPKPRGHAASRATAFVEQDGIDARVLHVSRGRKARHSSADNKASGERFVVHEINLAQRR
jgi:hypothetical protein